MQPNDALYERYPHLLNAQTDPETVALIEQLDTLYRSPEPPARLTLAAVLAQSKQDNEQALRPARLWVLGPLFQMPRRASTVAIALALAIILMAGSVYAFTPFLSRIFSPPDYPSWRAVFQNKLFEEVYTEPQTISGFTMNVGAAYADANRILIGYVLTGPAGHTYTDLVPNPLIITPQGDHEHPDGGMGPVGKDAYVVEFPFPDRGDSNPGRISLRLTVDQIFVQEQGGHNYTVHGSMVFVFSVTFHPGRVAHPRQSVTANGQTITLDRVVVTLTMTRVYLQGQGVGLQDPQDANSYACFDADLTFSDSPPSRELSMGTSGPNEIHFGFEDDLFAEHGEWTLTIHKCDPDLPPPGSFIGDPWIFHFVVP